ncbi:MAG: magnesium transporter CorA family protein [Bacteroidetes bacterium]|nr:magnesium transporter CorA family protein [Bacteroidota bacterium]
MIKYYRRIDNRIVEIDGPQEDCWINAYPPFEPDQLNQLAEAINVPFDFLGDSIDINERSRYEEDDGVKLIVINTPIENFDVKMTDTEADYVTIPVGIILTDTLIVTLSSAQNPVLEWFVHNVIKNLQPNERHRFVLRILEKNTAYFLHYLNEINKRRYLIEKELYNSSRNQELSRLLNIQKSLVYFATNLRANELLMMKIKRGNLLQFSEHDEDYDILDDIIIDNSQAVEMSNVYANILNGTMDAFASIISNNLNLVMRRLTSITVILMIPTLIASLYGMNVRLPFAERPGAFFMVLLLSGLISLLLFFVFRARRWF